MYLYDDDNDDDDDYSLYDDYKMTIVIIIIYDDDDYDEGVLLGREICLRSSLGRIHSITYLNDIICYSKSIILITIHTSFTIKIRKKIWDYSSVIV